jgi:hypothetical protein
MKSERESDCLCACCCGSTGQLERGGGGYLLDDEPPDVPVRPHRGNNRKARHPLARRGSARRLTHNSPALRPILKPAGTVMPFEPRPTVRFAIGFCLAAAVAKIATGVDKVLDYDRDCTQVQWFSDKSLVDRRGAMFATIVMRTRATNSRAWIDGIATGVFNPGHVGTSLPGEIMTKRQLGTCC